MSRFSPHLQDALLTAQMPQMPQMDQTTLIAIIAAAVVLLVVLVLALRRRGKGAEAEEEEEAEVPAAPEEREAVEARPKTKEVFTAAPEAAEAVEAEKAAAEERAAEAERKAAEKEAEEAKAAEEVPRPAEDVAAAERKAAEDKAAEAERKAAEKKAEEARAAEAERKAQEEKARAEAERKAAEEAERKAAEEKARAEAERKAAEEEVEPKSLRDGLGKTRKEGFIARISRIFSSKDLEEDVVDQLEEVLFTADIGVKTADHLLESVRGTLSGRDMGDLDRIWEVLRLDARSILEGAAANDRRTRPKAGDPRVVMVMGVNGSGKTTTIGKLAHQLVRDGESVLLVAGDTFRAAAAEQLEQWGRRVGAPVFRGKEGADPGSVVFDGVRKAAEDGADVVLVDTAGRLHTQVNLMEELKKVYRVTGKALEGAPHEVLLVLDATTGQNAIQQAQMFGEACEVTGIVLTKLDGTAKGGIVLGVCDEMQIPIRFVGVGERVEDLRPFDPEEFVDALFAN